MPRRRGLVVPARGTIILLTTLLLLIPWQLRAARPLPHQTRPLDRQTRLAKAHVERAQKLVSANKFEAAAQHLGRSLAAADTPKTRVFLGWVLKRAGKTRQALLHLKRASLASSPARVSRELARLDEVYAPTRVVAEPVDTAPKAQDSTPPPADTTSKAFLLDGLAAASYVEKSHSMRQLAQHGYVDTIPRVIEFLVHPDKTVRLGAIEALGTFAAEEGLVPLLEALWRERDPELAEAIITSVHKIGSEKALNGLYQYRWECAHPLAVEALDDAVAELAKQHAPEAKN